MENLSRIAYLPVVQQWFMQTRPFPQPRVTLIFTVVDIASREECDDEFQPLPAYPIHDPALQAVLFHLNKPACRHIYICIYIGIRLPLSVLSLLWNALAISRSNLSIIFPRNGEWMRIAKHSASRSISFRFTWSAFQY